MGIMENIYDNSFLEGTWQMTNGERTALIYLLQRVNPELSIEIGTFHGGSLAPISQYSKAVYSFDIDHSKFDKDKFSNVNYITGDSTITVPKIIDQLNHDKRNLEFVLIDGDHSENGVKSDIESILKYKPKKPLYIIMHDSFNPYCRLGILNADWESSPYVHYVELDFVHGIFHQQKEFYRQMWGGLALAVLLPEKREKTLTFSQSQALAFRLMFDLSVHSSDVEIGYRLEQEGINKLICLQHDNKNLLQRIDSLVQDIKKENINELIIYGAGNIGTQFINILKKNLIKIKCFVDKNEALWGEHISGIPIYSFDRSLDFGVNNYIIGSIAYKEEIENIILSKYKSSIAKPNIFALK